MMVFCFPIPLMALALSAFAIGTTEFIIMGLLPEIATDLGVSLPSAGMLVSSYALGVTVGAPILAALTARVALKNAMLALMGLFVIGNLMCAFASGYGMLMAGRVVASFAHGAFFGLGAVVAANMVPADKQSGAIALMFTGLTLANVLGVPSGTMLGQALGWRAAFLAVTALGVLSMAAITAWVPSSVKAAQDGLGAGVAVLRDPLIWLALALTVVGFGSVFVVFTYIAPILREITGIPAQGVVGVLVLFGVGLAIGNTLGGKLADHPGFGPLRSLLLVLAALTAVLIAFYFTDWHDVTAVITVFLLGVAAFATLPPLQMHVVRKSANAPTLASTLNIGAFNLGNAGGAFLGGAVLSAGHGLAKVPLAGAAVAFVGLVLTGLAMKLEGRGAD